MSSQKKAKAIVLKPEVSAASTKPTKLVVMPALPTFDKILSLYPLFMTASDQFNFDIAFSASNQPTEQQYEKWNSQSSGGAYWIDVGDMKYHNAAEQGFRSSAEIQGYLLQFGEPRYAALAEIIGRNNETGELKHMRHSVVKLIREIYHLKAQDDEFHKKVVFNTFDVVRAWFWNGNRDFSVMLSDERYKELKKLWDGFAVSEAEVQPLTLPWYMKKLFVAGKSPKEIITKILWWINRQTEVKERYVLAEQQLQHRQVRNFTISGRPAVIVPIRNFFEGKIASREMMYKGDHVVLVLRNVKTRHLTVQTKATNVNLEALAEELKKLEPGLWYFEKRFRAHIAMNGSWQYYATKSTRFGDEAFIELMRKFITFDRKLEKAS